MRRMKLRLEPSRRVHAPAGGGLELQRVDVLQRVRPDRAGRRVLPARQPRQRGLRRDDDVPLPARRAGRRSCSTGPRSTNNDAFDAGGMRFEVDRAVRGAADDATTGKVVHARRAAADGRTPARRSPRTRGSTPQRRPRATAASSPMYGGEPVNDDGTPLAEDLLGRVRARPLRAARRRVGARSGSATRSGRSTASACATTRGARGSGRRRGGTAGSR